MKLQGQVAVITGAGRNIGKAIAKLFAAEGAKIAVIEMHAGRGQAVVDEINKTGQRPCSRCATLQTPATCKQW
jgi:NAD(P)-dependent dehydrogenase (short-subunit alcohol dehydrogenase family)